MSESYEDFKDPVKAEARMRALYGENKAIEDGAYDESLAVRCINGTFVGKRTGDVIAFRGIPYVGRQPLGDLRWKAPVDCVADDGVYEAYYFGHAPYQVNDISQVSSFYPQGEDCLNLNVWRAADARPCDRLPVMVWIHGGSYEVGSTSEPREEGTSFVAENPGVILVSVDYRLSAFGFIHLSHLPDGADYPDAQNLGLMDQLQALKWVHENIAAFGGDPDNVTIFGQSAGGGSVSLLPLVEGSHKYFRRVIAESGSIAMSLSTEQGISNTNELMEALGCKTVEDLRNCDLQRLVTTAGSLLAMRKAPERDGRFLPLDAYEAVANGATKDLVFMQGCTKDEFNYFVWCLGEDGCIKWSEGVLEKKMAQLTDEERSLVQGFCDDVKGERFESVTRICDQYWFNAPCIRTAELQSEAGGTTYNYYFRAESSVPQMRSGHAIELSSVFNHPEEILVTGHAFDETFAKTIRQMWVRFATCGDPSLPADVSPTGREIAWPAYDLKDKSVMVFDEFDVHVEAEEDLGIVDRERSYFLTKYYIL